MRKLLLILATLMPFGIANAATVTQTAPILTLAGGASVGTATLSREDNQLRVWITTTLLDPTHAYIVLLLTYQDPRSCATQPCNFVNDMASLGGNPTVNTTVVYLTGGRFVAGPEQFRGRLEKGAIGLTGRQVLEGVGIYNIFGADVQVIIRDMGVAGAGGVDQFKQIMDYKAGCSGSGGTNNCTPVQIATFDAN